MNKKYVHDKNVQNSFSRSKVKKKSNFPPQTTSQFPQRQLLLSAFCIFFQRHFMRKKTYTYKISLRGIALRIKFLPMKDL